MSFGSGGTGFSFGSNSNTNTNTFGGGGSAFGNNTSNTGTFGSSAGGTGFGGVTFGGGGGGFGSNTGGTGFGNSPNNNNSVSLFGNKPASSPFGSNTNTGSSLFGNSANTNTGFGASTGGFGSNSNTNAFGTNNNTGSGFSFGNTANKPAFGSSTTSAPLFGQGGSGTTGGFGSSTNTFGTGTALGGQVPPAPGTAVTPFSPFIEKDGTGPSSSAYQSLTFQEPYSKYSFEELRLADYNAGRQFGNNSGQAGGFGASTFGGFGSNNNTTNTGGFGSNTGSSLFGNNAATSSGGFGSNTTTSGLGGGGLFGSKPTTGGLFGSQSSGTTGGGLFGTSNTASTNTGFGGGGLFGNNNQNQNKTNPFGGTSSTPSFSFGASNTNTANTNTGGGLFGSNNATNTNQSSGGLFGSNNQQPQSGGLFGNNNNNTQQKSLFGGTSTGFGSTPQNQSSGGLFGNANTTNTGGGLFGNTNTQQNTNTGGGLFGSNNNANTGGGLFGNNNANNQQKPGGLFGSSFGNNNTGTSGGGLFGNSTSNNQQQSGGLFGNTNSANTGSGFSFGTSANKPATGSLFGNSNTNQQSQSGGLPSFGGLFGNSTNNQQNTQQQQDFRVSSLNDPNPYGQTSIWTGLPVPTPDNSKPLYTPLAATQKLKESQSKPPPSLRLNQSRYMTPPRRQGFGFSYSTYGTPNSAASTPGGASLSSSMYGNRSFNAGSLGRSFGKSVSANNLRSQFNGGVDGDSVLSPNAFNPTHTRWSGGNMRRLTIDRSIRTDLFSRPSLPALPSPQRADTNVNGTTDSTTATPEPAPKTTSLKKRVSFDQDTTGGTNGALNGTTGALVRTVIDDETPEPDDRSRSSSGSAPPEAPQPRGNELAVVPEDRASDHVSPKKTIVDGKSDPQPGDYWMKPSRAELSRLPREKLQKFTGFQVGRKGCGYITFDGAVDLTSIPLDDLFEKIVEIRVRSITVYPDSTTKPPQGKGLNVPSTLCIENSWPRIRGRPSSVTSGADYERHINRLRKIANTELISYDASTGVWTFKVPHYTRYGLDYDDDDDLSQSQVSGPPESMNMSQSAMDVDSDAQDSYEDEDDDDTFAFKQKSLPGQFGVRSGIDDYDDAPPLAQDVDENSAVDVTDQSADEDSGDDEVQMAGSFPPPSTTNNVLDFMSPNKPNLKASRFGTPGKPLITLEGDWAEQLQRTISPRKQNREALRDVQSKVLLDRTFEPIKPQASSRLANKNEFRTSIDIMNSLFSKHEAKMASGRKGQGKGIKGQAAPDFEFPYAKRAKTFSTSADDNNNNDDDESPGMTENDRLWHSSFKPKFTPRDGLIYSGDSDHDDDAAWSTKEVLGHVKVTSLRGVDDAATMDVKNLLSHTEVDIIDSAPFIKHVSVPFSTLRAQLVQDRATGQVELDIYQLLHVLFDDYEDEFSTGMTQDQKREFLAQIRKDRLSSFLSGLIWRRHGEKIKAIEKEDASSATTALLYLTAKNVKAACDALMQEKNYNLALLIAQIESADESVQSAIADQIAAWHEHGVISEMTEEIRALYELVAGNTGVSQGKDKVPLEDRASTFDISEKFELDWLQSFALALWYGRTKTGGIQDTVVWFQENHAKDGTASPLDGKGNEDPLWVILRLFASKAKGSKSVEAPVFPQALSSLSETWNSQRTFRLHHALAAAVQDIKVDQEKAEDLADTLSFEFSARANVLGAVYALLHTTNPVSRETKVKKLLEDHAATLPDPPEAEVQSKQDQNLFVVLVDAFKIPTPWIFSAKALLARSTNNPDKELAYQIQAQDLVAAHETLLRRVAPSLVIDEDWEALKQSLNLFGDDPEAKVGVTEWNEGGGVYEAFVTLMSLLETSRSSYQPGSPERRRLISNLASTLRTLNAKDQNQGFVGKDKERLEERVALREMGRKVADILDLESEHDGTLAEKKAILDLPLTADARLTHARTLGVAYYHGLMVAAAR